MAVNGWIKGPYHTNNVPHKLQYKYPRENVQRDTYVYTRFGVGDGSTCTQRHNGDFHNSSYDVETSQYKQVDFEELVVVAFIAVIIRQENSPDKGKPTRNYMESMIIQIAE